ncbi:PEPxxWA-CTERM sorting domain-containing protein [Sphingomonas sp. RS2018]
MTPKFLAACAAACLLSSTAMATDTSVTGGTGQRSLGLAGSAPLGQSFTAIDEQLTSFGFQFQILNAGVADSNVTFTLREGAGFDGAIVKQFTTTITGIATGRTPSWFDFGLTGTTLVSGRQYSAVLTGGSTRYGLVYGPNINLSTGAALGPDAYAGGALLATGLTNNRACDSGICDANFRFSGVTAVAAVPEPATWGMAIIGFGAIGAAQRRRRRAIATA